MKNIIIPQQDRLSPKVIIVRTFNDVDNILLEIKKKQPVIINVGNLSRRDGFRIIDFLSGYCFALNGTHKKIDDLIYRFEI